jgi:hypothetical protein
MKLQVDLSFNGSVYLYCRGNTRIRQANMLVWFHPKLGARVPGRVDTVFIVKGFLAIFEILLKIVSVRRSLLAAGNRAQETDPAITGCSTLVRRASSQHVKAGGELSLLYCIAVRELLSGLGDVLLLCRHRCFEPSGVLMGREGFARVVVLV